MPGLSVCSLLRIVLSLLFCTLLKCSLYAQSPFPEGDARWREAGLPYITTYSAVEYNSGQQNWDIVQDRRGVMYFANTGGLLEYDGVSWRQFRPGISMALISLSMDLTGRIWVGGTREFGYLAPDSLGYLKYVSRIQRIPITDREAEVQWGVEVTSQGVYFLGQNVLFRWSAKSSELKTWRPETRIGTSFVVEDDFYIRQVGVGLMRMEGDSLRLVPGGERFANIAVSAILPYSDSRQAPDASLGEIGNQSQGNSNDARHNRLLIATSAQGLFVYDGLSFQPLKTEADAYLQQNRVKCGTALADGRYALGTLYGGLVIIGRRGSLRLILDKATGLPDNTVYKAYTDSQGGLWLALNMGIARVELSSPITLHSQTPGLQTGVEQVLRHQSKIYASTANGVYVMKKGFLPGAPSVFQPIDGLKAQCRELLSADSLLLVTSDKGIYQIGNNRVELIKNSEIGTPSYFLRSRYDTSCIYVGFANGFGLMQLRSGRWTFACEVPSVHEIVEGMAEDGPGTLWLTTRYGVALHLHTQSLQFSKRQNSSTVKIERFGEAHGLTRGWVKVLPVNDGVVFSTNKGLRRFDPENRTFVLDSSFGGLFADTTWDFGGSDLDVDDRGRVWTSRSGQIGVAVPEPDGSYSWYTTPFRRFADFGEIWTFYIDQKYKGVYWFGGAYGIIRYDETIANDYTAGYPALIRRVLVNGDSVIYGGAYVSPVSMIKTPALAYKNNTIRIEYAAPYYDNEAANQYQYFLEGFDNDWSDWTPETKVDYRKLPEGNYRFHVRARNVYQSIGGESVFALKILPPWYRTWWSYLLYGVMVLGVLYAILRYESNRQQHKQLATLESLKAEKLKELDKLKSDFFANISHEFRTPLALILGPAEQLLEKLSGNDKKKIALIYRNSQRLRQLIDQLLDLTKLERSKMNLQTQPGDFTTFLKGLVMSFESLAEQKGIDLHFVLSETPQSEGPQSGRSLNVDAEDYFDRDKIEKIFINLLSNAFKFTPKGGSVRVTVTLIADCRLGVVCSTAGEKYGIIHPRCEICANNAAAKGRQGALQSLNCVEITVADTGEGIPAEQLPYIFDRFYQADSSSRRVHGGTGIGLALVKELVGLHHGSITVTSEEGVGTTFTICLPLGKKHLKPEQIVEDIPPGLPSKGGVDLNSPFEGGLRGMSDSDIDLPVSDAQQPTGDRPIILIIEDNGDVRAYIREQLENEYAILEAEDGEAGIARAIEAVPDLVISDVMMPKKDGYEVCRTLKTDQRTSHIPVILLTAKAGEQEKLAGLETGADAYVIKPFRQQELAVRVRKLIELRQKLRQRYSTATVIKPSEVATTSMDRVFLERVIAVIEANMGEENFGVEALASEAAMSISQLNRKLNALIGQAAGQMIRSMRLQRAAELLAKNAGTVTEICFEVGFNGHANFTRSFKKQFGCSPSAYQKTHRE